MSKTVDDFRTINNCAYHKFLNDIEGRETEYPDAIVEAERAGIAAAVRALRDELETSLSEIARRECCGRGTVSRYSDQPECCDCPDLLVTTEQVNKVFNEILGDAGERVAGVSVGNGETELDRTSGPAPATDPAPAVCVWAQQSLQAFYNSACGLDSMTHGNAVCKCQDTCPSCGLPIKFTEAK